MNGTGCRVAGLPENESRSWITVKEGRSLEFLGVRQPQLGFRTHSDLSAILILLAEASEDNRTVAAAAFIHGQGDRCGNRWQISTVDKVDKMARLVCCLLL